MPRFSVGGRSAATGATIDLPGAVLWNPHASIALYVYEIWAFKTVATADNHGLIRTSTIGTAGSTVTPDIDNHFARAFAPISLATLGLGNYSVAPTVQGPYLGRANLPAAIGAGFIWVFGEPIVVPAGTGLAVVTPTAVILQPTDFTYVWEE